MKSEYTSKRTGEIVVEVPIEGETFTLRPVKRTKVMLGMIKPDSDSLPGQNPELRALLTWFEDSLNRDHRANPRKGKPGHGDESIEGCQACRLYDRLNDDDDPLELETVLEVANDLMGEVGGRPTG